MFYGRCVLSVRCAAAFFHFRSITGVEWMWLVARKTTRGVEVFTQEIDQADARSRLETYDQDV